ncbi:MAG: acetoacetate--CoA ligase [Rhodocyclaceae bacterium]|nr:acetoacetate--CoA ligase [Rhodocyclaceae bacterium]
MKQSPMTELWHPDAARIRASNLHRFLEPLGFAANGVVDYRRAQRWSIDHAPEFWSRVWDCCGVRGDKGEVWFDPGEDMLSARFFPDGRLNFAENLLVQDNDTPALIAWGEGRDPRQVCWRELRSQALGFAQTLTACGVVPGDRVAAILPNLPEAIIAMLGVAAIGATFASVSPDFGESAVLDRFQQIAPKVLIACDGYVYGGKCFDVRAKVAAIRAALPTVAHFIHVPHLGLTSAGASLAWSDVIAATPLASLERFPFQQPLYLLFSSGTTGKPKCLVHGAGGTLLQHAKEHRLHADLKPGDRMFYYTTCGWMMWNWLASALAAEATLVLYDGAPFHPDGNILFDLAATERVTFFGVSAKYLDALNKARLRPCASHDLSALRTIASTGSPLLPEGFDYVYTSLKADVHLASISGGTDIVSCFVLGNPCGPVHRGEIQGPGLGMAMEVRDGAGKRVVGTPGELVCTRPFPSMPVAVWNDPGKARYRTAYFEKFPGVWAHGDYAVETASGGFIILGRSDATLNPGGVRIGTAEIYRQVEQIDGVLEALAVGRDSGGDQEVILFVVLRHGVTLDDALAARIRQQLRDGASPRHVPARIIAVPDLPRTKSNKISELAVKQVIHGRPIGNADALANPDVLDVFRELRF